MSGRDKHLRSVAEESDRIRFDRCIEADTYSTLAFMRPDVFIGMLDEAEALRANAAAGAEQLEAMTRRAEEAEAKFAEYRELTDLMVGPTVAERDQFRAERDELRERVAKAEVSDRTSTEELRRRADTITELRAEVERWKDAARAIAEAWYGGVTASGGGSQLLVDGIEKIIALVEGRPPTPSGNQPEKAGT